MYTHICIYIDKERNMHIYVYMDRERERKIHKQAAMAKVTYFGNAVA